MEEVCSILLAAGFEEATVEIFRANKVDRTILLDLDKDDMKELGVTALGDRKKLLNIIATLKNKTDSLTSSHEMSSSSELARKPPRQPLFNDYDDSFLTLGPSYSPSPIAAEMHRSRSGTSGAPVGSSNSVSPVTLSGDSEDEYSDVNGIDDSVMLPGDQSENASESTKTDIVSDVKKQPVQVHSNVPNYAEGWEEDFVVPKQFSEKTMYVLQSGKMSKSGRSEIVQMTASKMLNCCKYPTSEQCEEIGKKIFRDIMHSKGKDGYGSWSNALQIRFRNMRRKHQSQASGLSFTPPVKKKKPEKNESHVTAYSEGYNKKTLCSEQTYKALTDQIIIQFSKPNRNKTTLTSLMKETAANRHKWITEEKPLISEVLCKFPLLKDFDMLMIDFSILSGIEEPQKIAAENWTNWMPKIFHKGKLEAEDHRKTYQSISLPMAEMAKIPSERLCNHPDASIVLILLRKLLNSKMSKDLNEFLIILEDGDNIEDIASDNSSTAPYIIQIGPPNTRQWFIVVEKAILLDVNSIVKAIVAMIGCYYSFDIQYPKHWNACLLFIEKKLLGIKSGPPFTKIQLGTISDIESCF